MSACFWRWVRRSPVGWPEPALSLVMTSISPPSSTRLHDFVHRMTTLIDSHRPTSAQEVIDKLAPSGIDLVTVYRTLNTLVEAGIAQAVGTTDRGRRFEVHACEGCRIDHPHLECRRCGHLVCLEHGLWPTMIIPTELADFQVEEARLYLYGVCGSCRTDKKAP